MPMLSPERLWRRFSGDVQQYRGKRVGGELVLGRRWRYLSFGAFEVLGPGEQGRFSVALLMPVQHKSDGPALFGLDELDLHRLKASSDPRFDFFFRGSINC